MALVAQFWELVVQFADTGDDRVTRTYRLNEAAYADAAADGAALVAAVAAMTDCVVSGYRLAQVFIENALVLPANAQNENQALFSGKITGDPLDSATASVPGVKGSLMTGATGKANNIVNMSNVTVQAFRDIFTLTGTATLSDGETWDAPTVSGKRRHTKNNRG